VKDSTTKARLRADLEVPLDRAVALVDLVGMVLLVGVQVSDPPGVVDSVVIEDISSERAQEGLRTETPSGRDTKCALQLHRTVSVWYDNLFSLLSPSFLACFSFCLYS